ncbi:hypothetical protein [Amnibacterium setariae]|uniref:Uncharacterized protein n=1 Tax=Amnibacterium setariae TaxID=2306585 RepID=A0A3A1U0A9_9MICO|nr:hypothetical protein [Amnibacterium setariae]RIX29941.1 hypothetical protein D1781_00200 [Amnibacterium setariae]
MVVRDTDGVERRAWVTARDERMCEWLRIVRVTDVQAIRWVLGALNGVDGPVSTRRAQAWCARMDLVGLIERANLGGPGGSIVWGTYEATGLSRPNIYRQTTRHEVAVASVSARYINASFAWRRDERPAQVGSHQADGVAIGRRTQQLIEVELTPKRAPRYLSIFQAYRRRLDAGGADSVTYLCNDSSGRAVRAALRASPAGRAIADRVSVRDVFTDRGAVRANSAGARLPSSTAHES